MPDPKLFDPSTLDLDQLRALLAPWLAGTVGPGVSAVVRGAVQDLVDATPDADLSQALRAMATLGRNHEVYLADPFARRLARAYIGPLLLPGCSAQGIEHLARALGRGPTLLLGNHRSYVDTQLTDLLLSRQDPALADRLVTVAGSKVYSDPFRRIAALGLHTIKTAQSSSVASQGAAMSVRQVARIAGQTMRQAHALMQQGHAVLLYPEGRRSRDGQLGPFLRGVARYARLPGTQVLPLALDGSQRVFPIDQTLLRPAVVTLRLGEPFAAQGMDRDALLARARDEISAMLAM
ncbi:MAG: hypothetical protein GXP62_10965 [Oligoflexia bacterium]|nr:hypothetical protein [Oligoflexia bacterium]